MDLTGATRPILRILPAATSLLRSPPISSECVRMRTLRQQFVKSTRLNRSISSSSHRTLYQSHRPSQQAAAVKEDEADDPQPTAESASESSQPSSTPSPSSSRRERPPKQPPNPNDDLDVLLTNRVGDFGRARSRTSPSSRSTSNESSTNTGPPPPPSRGASINRMKFPESLYPTPQTRKPTLDDLKPTQIIPDTRPAPFRISAALGRSIDLRPQAPDLAQSLRLLEVRVGSNRVKSDFNKQRFHERPGLRRKRLVSDRWRRRFKTDFQATVRRVEELRRKGW